MARVVDGNVLCLMKIMANTGHFLGVGQSPLLNKHFCGQVIRSDCARKEFGFTLQARKAAQRLGNLPKVS